MKAVPSPIFVITGILLAAAVAAMADTVTLNSGETINGKISRESDKEIVVDVVISAGVTDEKIIPRSDVKSVSKTTADEVAFRGVKDLQPDTHSLQPAAYPPVIKTLETFLKDYPQSSHAEEVKKTLETFKQELARVKAGELKWADRWYTAKEAEKHKYQISAQMTLNTMRDQAASRDFISALNTFDQIEKNYPGSTAYPEAAELAQSMMRVAAMDMVAMQNKAKAQEVQFNSSIVLVPEPEKSQVIAGRKAQVAAAEAALAAAEKNGVKWKPLSPLSPKSFEALKTTLSTEAPLLEKLPVANMRSSVTITQGVDVDIRANHLEGVEAKLREAKTLWPQNVQITELTAELAALKAKSAPTAPAAPAGGKEKKK